MTTIHDDLTASRPKDHGRAPPNPDAPAHRPWTIRRSMLGIHGVLSLLLLAFSVAAASSFRSDLSAAQRRLASIPTEVYASRHGDIEYRLVGDGPIVLVSHGVNGGFDHGMRLTDEWGVFGEGYRFLYVSRFGYLKSSLPAEASARLQAAAYKELLDYLGIDQVFVFGNSAGGPSAMWFAIDYPDRITGLILHSSAVPGPVPATMPTPLAEHDFLYWAAIKAAPDLLLGLLLPETIRATLTDQEKAFVIENAFMAALPISERTDGIVFDNRVSTPSVNDVPFARIWAPTLILQAVDDPHEREGGRAMAERIAGSEFVGLTGGHFLLRQETRLQAEIARFVAKHR
ncbi:MAG: alpha/beta fold hydrolase [Chloroflexota bacterium]